uniref:Uncharacterized protein n=1 Tax=Glossina brevipalpis TaxID=37001 RepID=A0A1A9WLN8_9MUSC
MFAKCANYVGSRLPLAVNTFLKDTLRFESGKSFFIPPPCTKVIEPRCDPNYPEYCAEAMIERKPMSRYYRPEKYYRPQTKQTGMWKHPECCTRTCPGLPVRMDNVCYESSDKKREYQQTWISCPPLSTVEIEMRCRDDYPLQPIPRRKKEELPKKKGMGKQLCHLACKMSNKYRWLMPCKGLYPAHRKHRELCCYRAYRDGCDPPRNPPTCTRHAKSTNHMKKEPTPYPSYSECERMCKISKVLRDQCYRSQPPMCEVWEEFRKRLFLPPPYRTPR